MHADVLCDIYLYIAVSACNSGQFSQSQLCPYNYTYCSDSGAFDNITYLCLCQPGYLVIGNISTQYFYSELCAPLTTSHSIGTSIANEVVSFSITTPPDREFTTVMISLFCVTIALGLVAIGAVTLNVLLVLKTVKVKAKANGKGDLSGEQLPPVANASPLGTALIKRPNTIELAFSLGGESTYSVVEDYTSAAGAANVVNEQSTKAKHKFIEDKL